MKKMWITLIMMLVLVGCRSGVNPPETPTIPDYEIIVDISEGKEGIDLAFQTLADLGGGTLTLSEGTFVIDGPINLISNMIIQGQGENTVIKLADGFNDEIRMIKGNGVSNVTIRNLVVDGNKAAQQASGKQHGILFANSSNIQVLNVTIKNCLGQGLTFGSGTHDCRGEGIDAFENDTGIVVSSNNLLTNSQAHHNRQGVGIMGQNIIISNNYIYNNSISGILQSTQLGENDNININSNKIFDNGYTGITISCDNSTIQGNEFFRNGTYGTFGLMLIGEESDTVSNVVVLGNTFIGTGICLLRYCSNVSIQLNTIRMGDYQFSTEGIFLVDSTVVNTLVANNDLYQSGTMAAIRDNGTNTNFGAGNRVNDGSWIVGADYTP